MNKKYKTIVSNTVAVKVEGSYADEDGQKVPFKFQLTAKRLSAEDLQSRLEGGAALVKEFLKEQVTGWSGQRLILEEDDSPAAFTPEAFDALLNIAGMAMMCFNAFIAQQAALEKNS